MENKLFEAEGYNPGEELEVLCIFGKNLNEVSPIIGPRDFCGKHTITLMNLLSSYNSLCNEFCLKSLYFEDFDSEVQKKQELHKLLKAVQANVYHGLVEVFSILNKYNIGPVGLGSYLEEYMGSLNIQASYFNHNQLGSVGSLSRYLLLYKYQLGNFRYMSKEVNEYLNIPKAIGTDVSINISEYLRDLTIGYLTSLTQLVQALTIDSGGNEGEKAIYIKNSLCNLLFEYFCILELLGVNQNDLMSYIIKNYKNPKNGEDTKQ